MQLKPSSSNRARPGRRGGRERGQSLVEFAVVLPIFLLIVFATVDFGLGLRAWISVTNSAREGARIGAVRGNCDQIETRVINTSGGLVSSADQVDITPAACNGLAGSSVSVTVEYEYNFVTPLGGMLGLPGSIVMESTSNMRVE